MPRALWEQSAERTEQPTPLRLEQARREGRVPRSAELTSAAALAGAVGVLAAAGPRLLRECVAVTASLLDSAAPGGATPAAGSAGANAGLWPGQALPPAGGLLLVAAAAVAAIWLATVLAGVLQVGPAFWPARVRPDWARISPAAGLARLLSLRTALRGAVTAAKLAIVAAVACWYIREAMPRLVAAADLAPAELAGEAGGLACGLAWRIALSLLALAAVEYLYQRWQYRQDLRITRQALKDDLRQMEGDPTLRRRRRRQGLGLLKRQSAPVVPRGSPTLGAAGASPVAGPRRPQLGPDGRADR